MFAQPQSCRELCGNMLAPQRNKSSSARGCSCVIAAGVIRSNGTSAPKNQDEISVQTGQSVQWAYAVFEMRAG